MHWADQEDQNQDHFVHTPEVAAAAAVSSVIALEYIKPKSKFGGVRVLSKFKKSFGTKTRLKLDVLIKVGHINPLYQCLGV